MSTTPPHRVSLTLGAPLPQGGWSAVTDLGERLWVPAGAAQGWWPRSGQRVVAETDESGAVIRIRVPGSTLLP